MMNNENDPALVTEGDASAPFAEGEHTIGDGMVEKDADAASVKHEGTATVLTLSMELIVRDPNQPRKIIKDDEVQSLAETIKSNGLLHPIAVRPGDGHTYRIICGERRWLAVKHLGWKSIAGTVHHVTDAESAAMALVENHHRADLSPLEEADGVARYKEVSGLTVRELAKAIGESATWVQGRLTLSTASLYVRSLLSEHPELESHAVRVLQAKGIDDRHRNNLLGTLVRERLSVREVERRLRLMAEQNATESERSQVSEQRHDSGKAPVAERRVFSRENTDTESKSTSPTVARRSEPSPAEELDEIDWDDGLGDEGVDGDAPVADVGQETSTDLFSRENTAEVKAELYDADATLPVASDAVFATDKEPRHETAGESQQANEDDGIVMSALSRVVNLLEAEVLPPDMKTRARLYRWRNELVIKIRDLVSDLC